MFSIWVTKTHKKNIGNCFEEKKSVGPD